MFLSLPFDKTLTFKLCWELGRISSAIAIDKASLRGGQTGETPQFNGMVKARPPLHGCVVGNSLVCILIGGVPVASGRGERRPLYEQIYTK